MRAVLTQQRITGLLPRPLVYRSCTMLLTHNTPSFVSGCSCTCMTCMPQRSRCSSMVFISTLASSTIFKFWIKGPHEISWEVGIRTDYLHSRGESRGHSCFQPKVHTYDISYMYTLMRWIHESFRTVSPICNSMKEAGKSISNKDGNHRSSISAMLVHIIIMLSLETAQPLTA